MLLSLRTKKKIVVIRHAQSQAQCSPRHSRSSNYQLLDAKLSDKGIEQTKVCEPPRDIDLIVVSPLSRALQTACLVFAGAEFDNIPIIVNPDASEFPVSPKMKGWENVGRLVASIKGDKVLAGLHRLEKIDFSLLDGYKEKYGFDWWTSEFEPDKVRAKVGRLRRWLLERPEKKIAIVGHCNALMNLIQTPFRIPNCIPIYCRLYLTIPSHSIRIKRTDRPEWRFLFAVIRAKLRGRKPKRAEKGQRVRSGKVAPGTEPAIPE